MAGIESGQIACEVTGLTATAEEVVTVRPELVWDLIADVTRIGNRGIPARELMTQLR